MHDVDARRPLPHRLPGRSAHWAARVLLAFTFAFGLVWSVGGKVLESEAESSEEIAEGSELDARTGRQRRADRRWASHLPSRVLSWPPAPRRIVAPDVDPPRPRWTRPRARPRDEPDDHPTIG